MRQLALVLCLLAAPVAADPAATARAAADALRTATATARHAPADGYARIAALTSVIRAYESGLSAMREGTRAARLRRAALVADLDDEAGRIGAVLGALATMGQAPEAALLLHPDGPVATARAGILMRDALPALLAGMAPVHGRLEEVARLDAVQATELDGLERGLSMLQAARIDLASAIEARGPLPPRLAADRAALDRIAADAAVLSDFADRLEALPPGLLPGTRAFADALGTLPLPAVGRQAPVAVDASDPVRTDPGWTLLTAPDAVVTSPWPATIRYAGPLLDDKNVMVLEPSEGYLMVFSGLHEVYGSAGDVLTAGTPVGRAGQGPGGSGAIYMEVRRNGRPQDPATWFGSGRG